MLFARKFSRVMAGVKMQGCCVFAQVVNSMRNDLAIAGTGEVMVIDDNRFYRINNAFTIKITQQFFLFGVDTDHWFARIKVGRFAATFCSVQPSNI